MDPFYRSKIPMRDLQRTLLEEEQIRLERQKAENSAGRMGSWRQPEESRRSRGREALLQFHQSGRARRWVANNQANFHSRAQKYNQHDVRRLQEDLEREGLTHRPAQFWIELTDLNAILQKEEAIWLDDKRACAKDIALQTVGYLALAVFCVLAFSQVYPRAVPVLVNGVSIPLVNAADPKGIPSVLAAVLILGFLTFLSFGANRLIPLSSPIAHLRRHYPNLLSTSIVVAILITTYLVPQTIRWTHVMNETAEMESGVSDSKFFSTLMNLFPELVLGQENGLRNQSVFDNFRAVLPASIERTSDGAFDIHVKGNFDFRGAQDRDEEGSSHRSPDLPAEDLGKSADEESSAIMALLLAASNPRFRPLHEVSYSTDEEDRLGNRVAYEAKITPPKYIPKNSELSVYIRYVHSNKHVIRDTASLHSNEQGKFVAHEERISSITDQARLMYLSKDLYAAEFRRLAVEKIENEEFLLTRIRDDSSDAVRMAAVNKLKSQMALGDVAEHSYYGDLRDKAFSLLL